MKVTQTPSPEGRQLKQAIAGLGKAKGRVGWFPSAKYEDGTPVAGVMAVQEHGSAKQKIPPRPYFRPTAQQQQTAWAKLATGAARAVVNGKLPPDGPMRVLTMQAESDVRDAIIAVNSPALSILTLLARKHRKNTGRKVAGGKELGEVDRAGRKDGPPDVSGVSTKPLNDTGLALATLSHEVTQ